MYFAGLIHGLLLAGLVIASVSQWSARQALAPALLPVQQGGTYHPNHALTTGP
jgi:hypothetical protein